VTRDRTLILAIAAGSLALVAPLAWPLVNGRVFVYNDLTWFHLPTRYLYEQALRRGDSLLWTPAIYSGLYLHGEGQIGILHPLHLLLYRALPLQTAFNLELIVNYVAAFGGMYWFLGRLQYRIEPALFGAMLFAFSGFNLLHHHHLNMVATVAHLPWLLAATDVLLTDGRRQVRAGAFATVAGILASELLLGFPQGVWWNVIALAWFAAYRVGEIGRWRPLIPPAGAILIGLLLGGIQLVPSADSVLHSLRATATRDFALTYSLHPLNVLQLWSPYAFTGGCYGPLDYPWFHEFGIYSGALPLVSLAWLWVRRRALTDARRRLATALVVLAVVALILAFGRHGGADVLLTHLPLLQSLRAPTRYIVLTQFALAVVAAMAIEDLLAIREGRTEPPMTMRAVWVPVALGILTVLVTALFSRARDPIFAGPMSAVAGLAFVVAATVLIVLSARRVPWALAALAAFTAFDLGAWGIRLVYHERPRTIESLTQAIEAPGDAIADSYAAAPAEGPYRGDLLVLRGYRLTSGYVALYPSSRNGLDTPAFLRLSGTRWIFSTDGVRMPAPPGVARARLLDSAGREAPGRVGIVTDRPGHIVVRVETRARAVLALTERFDDGWSATDPAGRRQVVAVEGDFLGSVVAPGLTRIEFRFMPRSFLWGVSVTAAGAALLAVGIIVMLRGGAIRRK